MRYLAAILILAQAAWPQVATEANSSYESADDRQCMIKLLSGQDRARRLQPEKLVEDLRLPAGATVVDLGTGAGFLLPHLSQAVGADGKVIAEDIHNDFLDAARKTAAQEKLTNVEYVVGTERDPNLPEAVADVILALDAYHHFNYPEEMLVGIRQALRDGGRFVIVDYYKSGFRDPDHIRLDKPAVIQEVEANGFRLAENSEHIPGTQYRLEFRKK